MERDQRENDKRVWGRLNCAGVSVIMGYGQLGPERASKRQTALLSTHGLVLLDLGSFIKVLHQLGHFVVFIVLLEGTEGTVGAINA